MKKPSVHNSENAISYLSDLSGSFNENYKNINRFKERLNLFVQKTIKYIPENSLILDLGCGPGVMTYALSEKGYKVTGIDGSGEMIRLARSKTIPANSPIFFQKNIPFNPEELDQRFDAIISSSLLEYLDEYDKTIKLVKELLNADGIFIASVPNIKSWFRKLERLIFFLWGRPTYFKFVKNRPSLNEFTSSISTCGFECIEYGYFAAKGPLFRLSGKILPQRYVNNMLYCVFRKTKETS